MKRRRIKPAETVSIAFTARERLLVLDHTFAGGEAIEPLQAAREIRGRCVVKYTLDDLDELLGYVAAEANHSKSKKVQADLDALHDRLQTEMQAYDDGRWQEPSVTLGLANKQPSGAGRATLSHAKGRERP